MVVGVARQPQYSCPLTQLSIHIYFLFFIFAERADAFFVENVIEELGRCPLSSVASRTQSHGQIEGFAGKHGLLIVYVIVFLDMNNEFFFDQKTNKLYYFWDKGTPSSSATIEATHLKTFFSLNGTQAAPVVNTQFLGLKFRDTALR
jgi:hypothetical protein